jgi:hypothetical protein
MAILSTLVLPEPFGPMRTVGRPAANTKLIRSRIFTPFAVRQTSSRAIGSSVSGECAPVTAKSDLNPSLEAY